MATRDLIEGLQTYGWSAKVFTGPALDFERGESPARILSDQQIPFEQKSFRDGTLGFSLIHSQTGGVPATIFQPDGSHPPKTLPPSEAGAFLALYERVLDRFQPDVLLTYGGQSLGWEMMKRARDRGIKVVFALHNLAYRDAKFFAPVDAILVPSQFCAEHYKKRLGLDCTAIPSPIVWSRILCEPQDAECRYVTFVNPQPTKGVLVFARIAHELGRRRPEIPLLVVEGRSQVNWLKSCPLDLSGLQNLNVMANTPDPRDFYRATRITLMPSLGQETFGRIAAESLINGIPVLASNRGSLPEVLWDAGFLLDIPARSTPGTALVPTAEEAAPWIETLLRLWDDQDFYRHQSRVCRQAAQKWQPERIFSEHNQFFRNLCD